jgi:flagellar motor switch/type III secretory pathway protein FliN
MTAQLEIVPETVASASPMIREGEMEATPDVRHLLAVPMRADLVLGTLNMKLGEISRLGVGSILKTGREASNPLDLLINSAPIAVAEVAPQGEKLAVRVLELHAEAKVTR